VVARVRESDSPESSRSPAGHYLRDFTAHGMSDEYEVSQLQHFDYTLNVVGLG
jgi:hypothetical protein